MYKIINKSRLNSNTIRIEVEAKDIARNAQPGQFVILRVGEFGERIPLTIHDKTQDSIVVIYQMVGASTKKLNQLEAGDFIDDVVGPLGEATDLEHLKKAIVVGGGLGCAIAFPIAKALHDAGVHTTSIIGFRSKEFVILEEEFKQHSDECILVTDDGSYQRKALVTEPLRELLMKDTYDKVFVIGPLPMMKFVSLVTKEFNAKTIVSMNSIMVDGTGMCGGCRVVVNGETKFACVDGPDFDGHLVDFDVAIKRSQIYKQFEKEHDEKACRLLSGEAHE